MVYNEFADRRAGRKRNLHYCRQGEPRQLEHFPQLRVASTAALYRSESRQGSLDRGSIMATTAIERFNCVRRRGNTRDLTPNQRSRSPVDPGDARHCEIRTLNEKWRDVGVCAEVGAKRKPDNDECNPGIVVMQRAHKISPSHGYMRWRRRYEAELGGECHADKHGRRRERAPATIKLPCAQATWPRSAGSSLRRVRTSKLCGSITR